MCHKIDFCRQNGRRHSLVVMSEGAVDSKNKPITSADVKKILETKLGHDTRITVLGHVQRGGKPSAYDRIISCRMGAAAALALLGTSSEIPSMMIGVQGNQIFQLPLMECVRRTRAIDKAMKDCVFKQALNIRGDSFRRSRKILKRLESCGSSDDSNCESPSSPTSHKFTFAIMNVGAPAAGMNGCTRAFVRLLLFQGHTVLGISEGFVGLLGDKVRPMCWKEVDGWASQGGSKLGTNRDIPDDKTLPEIAAKFGEYKIQGLLIIGGFEAYSSLIKLEKTRSVYTAFRIPLCGVAATISNNVPGTEFSLGCDTSLNVIVSAMDVLRQSAYASRKRVFVVETMGGYCGFLANMVALAGGADVAYIFEEKFTIATLQNDISCLIGKFVDGLQNGILIRNENCSENFTTDFLCKLLDEESKGMFITRSLVLGHLQQGEAPSPFDRILGVKYASHAVDFLIDEANKNFAGNKVRATSKESACMIGLQGVKVQRVPLQELISKTDFKYRIPTDQWWMSLRHLIGLLAKHKEHAFLGEEFHRN